MREVYGWKEFRVGDLFEKLDLKNKTHFNKKIDVSTIRTKDYDLPLINAKHGNNGIMYYGKSAEYKSAEMTLGIVNDGAIATGDVYPHPEQTGVLYNAYLIKPVFEVSKELLCYLACVMQQVIKLRYSYDNKATWDKVKEDFIVLPVTPSGDPDFDYMTEYISELEAECVSELEAYLTVTGLDDYELTEEDKEVLEKMEKGKVKFGEFKIGDLFDVRSSNKVIFANNAVIYNTQKQGTHPYVTRSTKDNGIRGYIKGTEKELNKGNCLTFAQDTFTTFYQEQDFYTGNKVKILSPQINNFNKKIGLYIAEVINKQCESLSWGVNSDMNYIKSISLCLPVSSSGTPDFSFMSRYIRALEKQVITNVYEGKGKIIEKTKELTQQDD